MLLSSESLPKQIIDFFTGLFSTQYWPARWHCGHWTDFHGWLYIISDLMIWGAYFAIPFLLFKLLTSGEDIPFPKVFWLFIAFILLCGTTHLLDALIFWWPAYRFSALVRFITGAVSLTTVFALYKALPLAASLRTASQLQNEIEQRKKAELEARAQQIENERTKELLRIKDEFITLVSHELKTPLTSLRGYLQIAAGTLHTPDDIIRNRNFISKANSQADRLTTLVNDLFQASKLQIGQEIPLKKESFDLTSLIEDIRDGFSTSTAKDIQFAHRQRIVVYADKDKIGQVLRNLVDNAIKYSPDSDTIIINAEVLNDAAKVSVKDFGIGISEEKLKFLFNRYYRVEATSHKYSGMGLGLYISSEIVKQHGGEIAGESVYEKGSTFWFTVPVC